MPSEVAERLKALERENRELRQANEILRKASGPSGTSGSFLLRPTDLRHLKRSVEIDQRENLGRFFYSDL